MNSARAWIVYTVVRLLAFAIPVAAVMLAMPGWEWSWLVAVAAGAAISALVSYIFLRPQREAMAAGLAAGRAPKDDRSEDELAEDEALDHAGESSLERAEEGVEADEAPVADELFEEEATPAPHEVEPRDGAADPEDIDASATSSLEQAPADEDTPHDAGR